MYMKLHEHPHTLTMVMGTPPSGSPNAPQNQPSQNYPLYESHREKRLEQLETWALAGADFNVQDCE